MWTYRALTVAAILTPVVPSVLGYHLSWLIGLAFYVVNVRARRQVLDNLGHVMPRCGRLVRHRAAVRVFVTVITNYYDLLRLRTVDRDRLIDLVDIHGRENLERALQAGRGAVILSAHMGNFSVVGQFPSLLDIPAAVIAERIDPPQLFGYMSRLRSAMGLRVLPPGREAIGPLFRLLRQNGVILVAGDRDVNHQGMLVEFFGAPASLPPGPVLLAMRSGAALIPAYTIRTSKRRSAVYIRPPLQLARSHDRDADLQHNLRLMARCLEEMIASEPDQWAVLQRIWGGPPHYLDRRAEGIGPVPRDLHLPPEQQAAVTTDQSRPENQSSESAT